MSSMHRLIAAIDGFVRNRRDGVRTKKHLQPLNELITAELLHRGVRADNIYHEVSMGAFFNRPVDCVVRNGDDVALMILLVTQTGSVRKNLTNRRRDILGDAVNLRAAYPQASTGVIYLLTADSEALHKGPGGASAIDDLIAFLSQMRQPTSQSPRPLLDSAALIAAQQDHTGRVTIYPVPNSLNILSSFFESLLNPCHTSARAPSPSPPHP
jgi:hypothetical protein